MTYCDFDTRIKIDFWDEVCLLPVKKKELDFAAMSKSLEYLTHAALNSPVGYDCSQLLSGTSFPKS
jgi:hypothetical protein